MPVVMVDSSELEPVGATQSGVTMQIQVRLPRRRMSKWRRDLRHEIGSHRFERVFP